MEECAAAYARPTARSDKTVPLDHNEVFGPMQPANLVVIADHFTERAGGRPHTDVRIANVFDPGLVKLRLTGAVGRDVETLSPIAALIPRQSLIAAPGHRSDRL